MRTRPTRINLPVWSSRYLPTADMIGQVQAIEASGVADDLIMWDQLMAWYPAHLWNEENTPLASLIPDFDSFPDPAALGAYLHASAPGLGLALTADVIRQGPTELMRSMLTLANLTEGRTTFNFGAGEVKQCKPFGWKRSEGLARMEDAFRIFREYLKNEGPISFKGNKWTLDRAWIGDSFQHTPRFYGMGGGAKIMELACAYADGFSTALPCTWGSLEKTEAGVNQIRARVADHGRDPDDFDIGGWIVLLIHEDPNVIDRALDNPFMKWIAAIWGRTNMSDWREEGIEPPMPDGWNYAIKMVPTHMSVNETDEMLSKVTRRMTEMTFIYGNPSEVAGQLGEHVERGLNVIYPLDYLAVTLDPDDAAQSLPRGIEMCRILKDLVGDGGAATVPAAASVPARAGSA